MASTGSSPVRALVACLAVCAPASAALLPPERSGPLPHLAVSDDRGEARDLSSIVAGAPALLLPVFTRCTGTCPMTAHYLKQALANASAPFRVIVFSFDPADTAADLRDFRERLALPARWHLVRSPDPGATRAFLDALDFHFMRSGGGFDHPTSTFVFSPRSGWAATLAGAAFTGDELETAWARALAFDHPTALQRLSRWLIRPATWILIAGAGLFSSLFAILLSARRIGFRGEARLRRSSFARWPRGGSS